MTPGQPANMEKPSTIRGEAQLPNFADVDTRSGVSTLGAYPRHQVHFVPIATAIIALAVGRT